MSAIDLTNVTKAYGEVTAVENLNLAVEQEEIHGFLDPVVRALPIESVKNQLREVIELKVLSK